MSLTTFLNSITLPYSFSPTTLVPSPYLDVHEFDDVLVRVAGAARPSERVAVLAVVPRREHLAHRRAAPAAHLLRQACTGRGLQRTLNGKMLVEYTGASYLWGQRFCVCFF